GASNAIQSTAADGDATAALGTATRLGLGHPGGAGSLEAANERRAAPVAVSAETTVRAPADARFQLASGDAASVFDPRVAPGSHDRAVDALTASLGGGAAPHGAAPA